jgi:hypothetical protein
MENGLEVTAFRWIRKDNLAKPNPIGLAREVKCLRSESVKNRLSNVRVIRE